MDYADEKYGQTRGNWGRVASKTAFQHALRSRSCRPRQCFAARGLIWIASPRKYGRFMSAFNRATKPAECRGPLAAHEPEYRKATKANVVFENAFHVRGHGTVWMPYSTPWRANQFAFALRITFLLGKHAMLA